MKNRLVLAALLLPCLAAAGDAAMRPEVARLIPPESRTVAGADLQALRSSPMFQRLAPSLPFLHGDAADLLGAVGFDLERDIARVYVASNDIPGQVKSSSSLIVAEGAFDFSGSRSAILSLLRDAGEHRGVPLYRPRRPDPDEIPLTFAFPDARTAVIGERDRVQGALDRFLQTAELSRPARAALAQGDAHVWLATLEPQALLGFLVDRIPGGGGAFRPIVDAMQTLSLRGTADAGSLRAQLGFLCANADDARSLSDAAQAMAAFGALATQSNRPELAKIIGTLQIRNEDREASLSVDLTEAQLLHLRHEIAAARQP